MDEQKSIGYAEEDWGGYEWGFCHVFNEGGRFYMVYDSGCSCNGPKSHYSDKDACVGPAATLGGLFDQLNVDSHKHNDCTKRAFVDAIERMNNETLAATKAALGLT